MHKKALTKPYIVIIFNKFLQIGPSYLINTSAQTSYTIFKFYIILSNLKYPIYVVNLL